MNDEAIINTSTFAELKANVGDEFVIELIDAYLEDTPKQLDALQKSLAGQDAPAFSRAAHSIKSSSASLGALAFSIQSKELEMVGKLGDLSGAGEKLKSLLAEFTLVEKRLKELRDA